MVNKSYNICLQLSSWSVARKINTTTLKIIKILKTYVIVPFFLFFICIVGGGIKVHSTLRPLNGLLCQPRLIMIVEKSLE
jgi:hypothetical protein